MAYRVPESRCCLPRQGSSRGVGNRAGDNNRNIDIALIAVLLYGKQSGLGVKGIEDGFDHEQIDLAIYQSRDSLEISVFQLIESDVAKTRIIDIG